MSQGNYDSLALQRNIDASLRLARIFISQANGVDYEWDGTKPKPGDTLFVYYVKVSDETYRENIPLDAFVEKRIVELEKSETPGAERYTMEKRTFEQLRGIKNGVTISYLHNTNNGRHNNTQLYGHIETHQARLLTYLMIGGNIFQNNKDFSCWYMLNGPDAYSQEYDDYQKDYDFLDVTIIDDHDEFNTKYTLLQTYVKKNVDRHVLIRETGGSENCFRCRLKIKTSQGGGKTRRKFKVKKRRNRRIKNTMKRRKTALKRRKTALKRRNR